jgi:hypothetical protein
MDDGGSQRTPDRAFALVKAGFLDDHGARWTPSTALLTGRFGGQVPGGAMASSRLRRHLLVVSLEVPSSYDELLEALAGFPALAIAFAAIVSLWAIHRESFARYPLGDGISMFINAVLLSIVLIDVYPLELLAELGAHEFLRVGNPTVSDMTPAQAQGVYIIFALAVLHTCLAVAALHLRAWQLRGGRRLDDQTQADLVAGGRATWDSAWSPLLRSLSPPSTSAPGGACDLDVARAIASNRSVHPLPPSTRLWSAPPHTEVIFDRRP